MFNLVNCMFYLFGNIFCNIWTRRGGGDYNHHNTKAHRAHSRELKRAVLLVFGFKKTLPNFRHKNNVVMFRETSGTFGEDYTQKLVGQDKGILVTFGIGQDTNSGWQPCVWPSIETPSSAPTLEPCGSILRVKGAFCIRRGCQEPGQNVTFGCARQWGQAETTVWRTKISRQSMTHWWVTTASVYVEEDCGLARIWL